MRTTSNTRGRGSSTALVAIAALATCATLVTGCSSSDDSGGSSDSSRITLRIGTFGQFGYTETKLYDEYMSAHPNIKIVQDNNTDAQKYWDALKLHIGSGSGVDDIQAIEVGYIAEATSKMYDKFVDLSKASGVDSSHWVDYKWKQATTAGGQTIGLGTDVGPMAVCYRADLFKAAGLPTDRERRA